MMNGDGMFIDFKANTFDMTNALCAMFLWILFGYLGSMVNCDLQRMIDQGMFMRHMIGLLSFYFLFTLLDGKNAAGPGPIFLKTVVVYVLFIFTCKSKWYFVLPVLVLLMLDQVMKKQYEFKAGKGDVQEEQEGLLKWHTQVNAQLNVLIITLIIVGMLHYMWLQYVEYGEGFSIATFFFAVNKRCKPYQPNYDRMGAATSRTILKVNSRNVVNSRKQ